MGQEEKNGRMHATLGVPFRYNRQNLVKPIDFHMKQCSGCV